MILLKFTVRNHRSIRDEVSVDLSRPCLRTLTPKDGDWLSATYRVAGIFGGNGTGKSAVVDALNFALRAVAESSTSWQALLSMQRVQFRLDAASRDDSSTYELEFVADGRRHVYGFEIDACGVKREWLRDVPSSRWRTLLDRDRDARTLKPSVEVTDRELVLSRALQLPKSLFHGVAVELTAHFDVVLVHHAHREARLAAIANMLADGSITFVDLQSLLQVADIGVANVSLEERDLPEHLRVAIGNFMRAMNVGEGSREEVQREPLEGPDVRDQPLLESVVRRLLFTHCGADDGCTPFSIHDESDGTVAWLAIAVPALEALRTGGLILVDEIDASLHPHLLDLLLGAFADREVNVLGAQIIFTSHESYVLSPLSEVSLQPEQVWFTDRSVEGVTELTSLADFPRHADANVAKRYLTGRYGGTPRLSPSLFGALVDTGAE
ncbi:hypothetical protein KEM60_02111 [Austwickia sp. TVS 96-490-7B]|uniref:AAA family ATPase n=1 Tax=Austwickia sp. TVS 96-490-7B TaxID=2830843 RepID=UPI001C581BEF|nr:AAA family ATPase [Austwickia sp. TVS 96-490-7B]MBW3085900.1 hypothetical protein [Austwickia sp. TVS 96-490-7B]